MEDTVAEPRLRNTASVQTRPKPAAEHNKQTNTQNKQAYKQTLTGSIMWLLPYFITLLANCADVNYNVKYKY